MADHQVRPHLCAYQHWEMICSISTRNCFVFTRFKFSNNIFNHSCCLKTSCQAALNITRFWSLTFRRRLTNLCNLWESESSNDLRSSLRILLREDFEKKPAKAPQRLPASGESILWQKYSGARLKFDVISLFVQISPEYSRNPTEVPANPFEQRTKYSCRL